MTEPRFASDFECGNGENFRRIDDHTYQFTMRPDTNSDDKQWFCFRIDGAKGRTIEMQLVDTTSCNVPAFWNRTRPVVSHDNGKTWQRIAECGVHDYKSCVYTFSVNAESDNTLVASHYPYSFTDHEQRISQWKSHPSAQHEIIGKSVEGRPIDLLKISEARSNEVPVIWITARQHAAESPASFAIQGFLDYLLSDDSRAIALRKNAQIYAIPMINPDGVFAGNYRDNIKGINLNRVWNCADNESSPEVKCITDKVGEVVKAGGKFEVFIDFHADSYAHEHYAFRTVREFVPEQSPFGDQLFEKTNEFLQLVARHAACFLPGKFASASDTDIISYRYMLHRYKVMAMIPEGGYNDISSGSECGKWLTPEHHEGVGRAFAIALQELYDFRV